MELRDLSAYDAESFWNLRMEGLESSPQAFGESEEEHRATPLSVIETRLAASNTDYFILGAFDNGRLVGTLGFLRNVREKSRHKATVWGVYVTPAWRGKGVGRLLMAELLERARAIEGLDQLHLSVHVENQAARALYRSAGFEVYGREPAALKIGTTPIDEDLMILRLGATRT